MEWHLLQDGTVFVVPMEKAGMGSRTSHPATTQCETYKIEINSLLQRDAAPT